MNLSQNFHEIRKFTSRDSNGKLGIWKANFSCPERATGGSSFLDFGKIALLMRTWSG
jgi:hypothetical protein